MGTESEWYAQRLEQRQSRAWKRLLRVQAPYQWKLKRQDLGRTLDVGCGIGRNLATLGPGSLGVDHNRDAVRAARARGLRAQTVHEFQASPPEPNSFDGLLLAHVLEHIHADASVDLIREYLPYLRPGGKVFMICPQERGYASDPTHVTWVTGVDMVDLAVRVGLSPGRPGSFPFPRAFGQWFIYNEFTLLCRLPADES